MSTMNQIVKHLQARRKQSERELEKLNLAIKALAFLEGNSVTTNAGTRRKPKFYSSSTWQDRSSAKSTLGENQGSAKEVVLHYHLLPSVKFQHRLCSIPVKARLRQMKRPCTNA